MAAVKQFFSPTRLIYGAGSLSTFAGMLPKEPRYVIVTDKGLAEAGIAEKVRATLAEQGVTSHVYTGVIANPDIEAIEGGLAFAREHGCASVVALGGGSSIDTAKGLIARLGNPDVPMRAYGDGRKVTPPVAPFYAIPTTSGTGSEVTKVAVITDNAANEKMAVYGDALAPLAAVLDPSLLSGLPPRVAADTGIDALAHALECYTTLNASPLTDCLAVQAVSMIVANLRPFVADPRNGDAAEKMLAASTIAGLAFSNAGLGLAHSLASALLGEHHHVSHGCGCGLYLLPVMEFNVIANPEKFRNIAELFGYSTCGMPAVKAAGLALEGVARLMADVDMPMTYKAADVDYVFKDIFVQRVLAHGLTAANPRRPNAAQVKALFEAPNR